MPEAFSCPSCGAPLEARPGETILRCPFCHSTIRAPENAAGPALATGLPDGMDRQSLLRLKEVRELALQGRTIDAIKLYRQITNVGLKEAKDTVDAMAAGRPVVLTGANVIAAQATFHGDPAEVMRQVEELLRRGDKIGAIKVYRETTTLGLKEAKDAVERVEAGLAPALPAAYPPSEPALGPNPFDRPSAPQHQGRTVTCILAVIGLLALAACALIVWTFLGNVNF